MNKGNAFTIEVHGEPAGIVIKEGSRFIFFASSRDFESLERQVFRGVDQAERAARQLKPANSRPRTVMGLLAEPGADHADAAPKEVRRR